MVLSLTVYTESNAVDQEISVLDWEDVADESGAKEDENDVDTTSVWPGLNIRVFNTST